MKPACKQRRNNPLYHTYYTTTTIRVIVSSSNHLLQPQHTHVHTRTHTQKPKSKVGKTKKKKTLEQSATQKSKTKGKKKKKGKKSAKEDTDGGSKVSSSKVNSNDHMGEIERRRAEKRALERQRDLEMEERARLEEELRRLQDEHSNSVCNGSEEGEGERGGKVERECGGVRRGPTISVMKAERKEDEDKIRKKKEDELERLATYK